MVAEATKIQPTVVIVTLFLSLFEESTVLTVETNQVLLEHLTPSLLRCGGVIPQSHVTFICYWTVPMMTIIRMKVLVKFTPSKTKYYSLKILFSQRVLLDTTEINQLLTITTATPHHQLAASPFPASLILFYQPLTSFTWPCWHLSSHLQI